MRQMADDLSWIDHPANLRANAVLLRAVADQSLLHADEIERLTAAPDGYLNKDDLIADLRNENDNLHEMNAKLHAEIERLRELCEIYKGQMKIKEDIIERLRAEFELFREAPSKLEVAQYEIKRLEGDVKFAKKVMAAKDDEIERLRAVLHDVERLTDERSGYPDPGDALRAIRRMVNR